MTANLGLEAPGATPLLQNIILYPYVNPPTEILDSSGMPSSLDVTPIILRDGRHPDMEDHPQRRRHAPDALPPYNVQVINRVTWDNIIIPPEPTELGWKETVRVSPLEDTIVALRPIVPTLPFGVPDSSRPLNPMMPIGAGRPNVPAGPNRLQQHQHRRHPDHPDPQQRRELRVGVRLPLPHPEPRGNGLTRPVTVKVHGRRRRRRRGCRSHGAASSSAGPTRHP